MKRQDRAADEQDSVSSDSKSHTQTEEEKRHTMHAFGYSNRPLRLTAAGKYIRGPNFVSMAKHSPYNSVKIIRQAEPESARTSAGPVSSEPPPEQRRISRNIVPGTASSKGPVRDYQRPWDMQSPSQRVLTPHEYKEMKENSFALSLAPSVKGNYLHEIREQVKKPRPEQPYSKRSKRLFPEPSREGTRKI